MCLHVSVRQYDNSIVPGKTHQFYKIVSESYKSPCYPTQDRHWLVGYEIEAYGEPSEGKIIGHGALHMFVSKDVARDNWLYRDSPWRRVVVCEVADRDIIAWGRHGDVAVRCCKVIREIDQRGMYE